MTDSDIRTLKRYLAECLEPQLKFADEHVVKYAKDKEDAKDALSADLADKLMRFYKGQSVALKQAIDSFKELFEEELKEGE